LLLLSCKHRSFNFKS